MSDRRSYLIAASNLVDDLPDEDNAAVYDQAILLMKDTTLSKADRLMQTSAVRFQSAYPDTRSAALLLAARTARTDAQQEQVRRHALVLMVQQESAAPFVGRVLTALRPESLGDLVPLLAAQPHWSLRALAAQAWVHDDGIAEDLGAELARDADPRVRQVLARELATQSLNSRTQAARETLVADVRHSVRRLMADSAAES